MTLTNNFAVQTYRCLRTVNPILQSNNFSKTVFHQIWSQISYWTFVLKFNFRVKNKTLCNKNLDFSSWVFKEISNVDKKYIHIMNAF